MAILADNSVRVRNAAEAEDLKLVRLDVENLPASLRNSLDERDAWAVLVYNVNGTSGGGGIASEVDATITGSTVTLDVNIESQASPLEVEVQNQVSTPYGIGEYDETEFTYVSSGNGEGEIETVVYKLNTQTVATLTYAYDSEDRLESITKSTP